MVDKNSRHGFVVAITATIFAATSAIFAGLQTRHLGMQTQQAAAASELSFNLEVMIRLQEVLFEVADDPASHEYIWGTSCENRRPELAGDSVIDVLSMALAAVERLPEFSRNDADWSSYSVYVLEESPALRSRVLEHPDWWPELTPHAASVAARAAAGDPAVRIDPVVPHCGELAASR